MFSKVSSLNCNMAGTCELRIIVTESAVLRLIDLRIKPSTTLWAIIQGTFCLKSFKDKVISILRIGLHET